jgi:hypothetical protein
MSAAESRRLALMEKATTENNPSRHPEVPSRAQFLNNDAGGEK